MASNSDDVCRPAWRLMNSLLISRSGNGFVKQLSRPTFIVDESMANNTKHNHQLELARIAMQRHEVALSVLAKGDASPFMTPDFKRELEKARKNMEAYA